MSENKKALRVHLFVSRNKDNRDVPGFKQRKKSFVTAADDEKLEGKFQSFVSEGVPGEYCRWYRSLNARDEDKIREELVVRLVRNKISVERISGTVASIAALPECAMERQWLFDFDSGDEQKLHEFLDDLAEIYSEDDREKIRTVQTVSGYSVIVPHGCDTRALQKKWLGIFTNKRDAMVFVKGKAKD